MKTVSKRFSMLSSLMLISVIVCGNVFAGEKAQVVNKKDLKAAPAPTAAAEKTAQVKDKAPAAPAAPKEDPNRVLATINGEKLTVGFIDKEIENRMPNVKTLPAAMKAQYMPQMRKKTVENIIIERLLDAEVKANKVVITDQQVTDKINEIAKQNNMTMDDLKAKLAELGKDVDALRTDVKKGMGYEELFNVAGGKAIKVTEEDAKKFYDENKKMYEQPKQVKASHILVKVEANATPEQKADAKKKIDDLLAKVKAGEDFAKLAGENSDCPSGKNGGDLGFFGEGQMVKPFADAAFAMNVGDVSDVVETQFGYHIIKVTDKKEAKSQTFDEVKKDVVMMLESQKKSDFARNYVESLKKNAKIEYSDEMKPETNAQEIKVQGGKK